MKKIICIMLIAFLIIELLPSLPVKAADSYDLLFTEITEDDVDIWYDGSSIHARYKDQKFKFGIDIRKYVVSINEYYNEEEATNIKEVFFYTQRSVNETSYPHIILNHEIKTNNTGTYRELMMYADNWLYCYSFSLTIKNGQAVSNNELQTKRGNGYYIFQNSMSSDNVVSPHCGKIYTTPLLQSKYKFYCSQDVVDNNDRTKVVIPCNPLPTSSRGEFDSSSMLKTTTIRMLDESVATYQTWHYSSCSLSDTDCISASGTILTETVNKNTGANAQSRLTSPQPMCIISSYGTVYDIVYTDDDTLCSLLGIEKPPHKVWDVENQVWKSADGSSDSNDSSGSNDTDLEVIYRGLTLDGQIYQIKQQKGARSSARFHVTGTGYVYCTIVSNMALQVDVGTETSVDLSDDVRSYGTAMQYSMDNQLLWEQYGRTSFYYLADGIPFFSTHEKQVVYADTGFCDAIGVFGPWKIVDYQLLPVTDNDEANIEHNKTLYDPDLKIADFTFTLSESQLEYVFTYVLNNHTKSIMEKNTVMLRPIFFCAARDKVTKQTVPLYKFMYDPNSTESDWLANTGYIKGNVLQSFNDNGNLDKYDVFQHFYITIQMSYISSAGTLVYGPSVTYHQNGNVIQNDTTVVPGNGEQGYVGNTIEQNRPYVPDADGSKLDQEADWYNVGTNATNFVSSLIPTIKSVFNTVGQIPIMLSDLIPFIPVQFWYLITSVLSITGIGLIIKAIISVVKAL